MSNRTLRILAWALLSACSSAPVHSPAPQPVAPAAGDSDPPSVPASPPIGALPPLCPDEGPEGPRRVVTVYPDGFHYRGDPLFGSHWLSTPYVLRETLETASGSDRPTAIHLYDAGGDVDAALETVRAVAPVARACVPADELGHPDTAAVRREHAARVAAREASTDRLLEQLEAATELDDWPAARAAVGELGHRREATAVSALVRALFHFPVGQVTERLEAAHRALVQVGPPAIEPLIAVLEGTALPDTADALAAELRRGSGLAFSGATIARKQAALTLGAIGDPRALDPLLVAARGHRDEVEHLQGLLRLWPVLDEAQRDLAWAAWERAYGHAVERSDARARSSLLAAAASAAPDRATSKLRPLLEAEERYLVLLALPWLVQVANAEEASWAADAARPDDDDPLRLAQRCGRAVSCYLEVVAHPARADAAVAAKAAVMLGRYGEGQPEVIEALVGLLAHPSLDRSSAGPSSQVGMAAVRALDRTPAEHAALAARSIAERAAAAAWSPSWRAVDEEAWIAHARLSRR